MILIDQQIDSSRICFIRAHCQRLEIEVSDSGNLFYIDSVRIYSSNYSGLTFKEMLAVKGKMDIYTLYRISTD